MFVVTFFGFHSKTHDNLFQVGAVSEFSFNLRQRLGRYAYYYDAENISQLDITASKRSAINVQRSTLVSYITFHRPDGVTGNAPSTNRMEYHQFVEVPRSNRGQASMCLIRCFASLESSEAKYQVQVITIPVELLAHLIRGSDAITHSYAAENSWSSITPRPKNIPLCH